MKISPLMEYILHNYYWRSERSERRHIQVMTIEICDIYIYIYI